MPTSPDVAEDLSTAVASSHNSDSMAERKCQAVIAVLNCVPGVGAPKLVWNAKEDLPKCMLDGPVDLCKLLVVG